MSSPTSFLGNSGGSSKLKYCLCRRAPCPEGKDRCELCDVKDKDSNFEGYLLRKVKGKDKLKKYWYSLLGNEMYVFDSKKEKQHKTMYNLVGVFVVEDPEEALEGVKLFPFTLVFPNTSRTFYLLKASDREKWMDLVKIVVGYSNIHDYYELKENIGKGKFAVVRKGVHKKTGKTVAVKILKKQEMTAKDLELQRREIEILKIC